MEDSTGYVSCVWINGKPILPPVMTEDLRRECVEWKRQAVSKEAELRARKHNHTMAMRISEVVTEVKSRLVVSNSCPQIDLLDVDSLSEAESDNTFSGTGPKSFEEIRQMLKEQNMESLDSARSSVISSMSEFSPRKYEPTVYTDDDLDDDVQQDDCGAGVYDSMISLNTVVENIDVTAPSSVSPETIEDIGNVAETDSERFRSRSGSYTLEKPSPLLRAHLMKFGDTSELDMSSHQRTPIPSVRKASGKIGYPKHPQVTTENAQKGDTVVGDISGRILSPVPQNVCESQTNQSPRSTKVVGESKGDSISGELSKSSRVMNISRSAGEVRNIDIENKENSPAALGRSVSQTSVNLLRRSDQHSQLSLQHSQLSSQRSQLSSQRSQLSSQHSQLSSQHSQLSFQRSQLSLQHGQLSSQRTLTPSWFPPEHLDVALSPFREPDFPGESCQEQLQLRGPLTQPPNTPVESDNNTRPAVDSGQASSARRAVDSSPHPVSAFNMSALTAQTSHNVQQTSTLSTLVTPTDFSVTDNQQQNEFSSQRRHVKSPDPHSDRSLSMMTSKLESAISTLAETHQRNLLQLLEKQERERQALRREFEARQRELVAQIVQKFPNLRVDALTGDSVQNAASQRIANQNDVRNGSFPESRMPTNLSQDPPQVSTGSYQADDDITVEEITDSEVSVRQEPTPHPAASYPTEPSNSPEQLTEETGNNFDSDRRTDPKYVGGGETRMKTVRPIPEEIHLPRYQHGWLRLTALVRGFLVRRLLATEKVQFLRRTIRETVACAVKLHLDVVGSPSRQDLDLHQRLMAQLDSACLSVHHIFFDLGIPERMAIIALDRAASKAKTTDRAEPPTGKMSAATLARLKKKEKNTASPLFTTRAKILPRKRNCRSISKDRIRATSLPRRTRPSDSTGKLRPLTNNSVPKRPAWK